MLTTKLVLSGLFLLLYFNAVSSNRRRNSRPNIILILTDDQDVMLGSMNVMHHTKNAITEKGIEFVNAFTTSPICCPSRSSILTGLYTHNHNVYTNNDNCSSVLWRRNYESKSYATYLNDAGYKTAYFGKYLNEYNGSYIPPGWTHWMGLMKNSKYYNYTLNHNGNREVHGDDYHKDYLTDLVTNRSIAFFRDSKATDPYHPVLSVVSFPAPHGPEDGAPQYQDLYSNVTSHITRSFDFIPNPDKHWIIRQIEKPMDKSQLRFSNILQQKRLQTLRSVDDNIKRIIDMLEEMGELDNTYILYTSDHGYHIGQYGLPKGKGMPYDFDIRIPFLLRGPKIPYNARFNQIALNIDVAPTILGMAGVPIPSTMDGRNLLDLLEETKLQEDPWRDSFLVVRGKMPRDRAHLQKPKIQKKSKLEKLKKLCDLPNYKNPCAVDQFWTCVEDDNKLKLQKCRKDKKPKRKYNPAKKKKCLCPVDSRSDKRKLADEIPLICSTKSKERKSKRKSKRERPNPKRFYRNTNQAYKEYKENMYKYMRGYKRVKRSVEEFYSSARNRSQSGGRSMVLTSKCKLYMPNFEIRCSRHLYTDAREWMRHQGALARSVKTLQVKMKYMKALRSCLNSYNDRPRYRPRVAMCDCPVVSHKPTKPKAPSTNSTLSHPLISQAEYEEIQHQQQLREFEEQREERQLIKEMKQAKLARIAKRTQKGNFRARKCGEKGLTCAKLTNSTWKTEPTWNGPDQCYCTNSNNNTYWCIRVINETTNLLYCEFITHFVEYYDLSEDPHQLVNKGFDEETHGALHAELAMLRKCRGAINCTVKRTPSPPTEGLVPVETDENEQSEVGSFPDALDMLAPNTMEEFFLDEMNRGLPDVQTQTDLDIDRRVENRKSGKPRHKSTLGRSRILPYRQNRRAKPRQVRRLQSPLKSLRQRKNKRQKMFMQ